MKRIITLSLTLLLALVLIACDRTIDETTNPTTTDGSTAGSSTTDTTGSGGEDGGPITAPNIVITEDPNDPNFLDGKKYEYTGTWGNEEYEKFNQDYRFAGLYN